MQNTFFRVTIAIALGAIPGAIIRYFITEFTTAIIGKDFSYYATFLINITGCFIIALFYTLNEHKFKNLSPEIKLMITTGFCGAYTTFSTYGLETFILIDKGNDNIALIYWLGSMVLGIIAIQLGVTLGKLNSQSD
jgi:CrcB protein